MTDRAFGAGETDAKKGMAALHPVGRLGTADEIYVVLGPTQGGSTMKTIVAAACLVALGVGFGFGLRARPAAAEEAGLTAMSSRAGKPVIARAWHGKTLRAKADEYEQYLAGAIKKFQTIKGNLGYQLMRLDGGPDGDPYTEFQVISYWDSPDSIKAYAGQDIRRTRDAPRDDEFLIAKEPFVRNYELRVNAIRP